MDKLEISFDNECVNESIENLRKILQECSFRKEKIGVILHFKEKPNEGVLSQIFDIFFCYKSAYLVECKIESNPKIEIINDSVHNGQTIVNFKPLVIIGSLNKGGQIKAYNDLCINGDSYGDIDIFNDSNVFIKNAIGATIHLENGLSRKLNGRNIYLNSDSIEEYLWQE